MNDLENRIPIVVIFRLAEYHCLLSDIMKKTSKTRITSKEIANYLGLSEEIIRKDLTYVPYEVGTPGFGYNIIKLYQAISSVLHMDKIHQVGLIGSIETWRGIINFFDPRKFGFNPVVIFSEIPGDAGMYFEGMPVYAIEEIPEKWPADLSIALVASDMTWVKRAVHLAISAGARGILNLTPTVLEEIPEDIYISQILLPCEIKLVTYHVLENLFIKEKEVLKRDIGKRSRIKRKKSTSKKEK